MLPLESMPELSIETGLLPGIVWASMEGQAPADVPARARRTLVNEQSSCAFISELQLWVQHCHPGKVLSWGDVCPGRAP